MLWTGRAVHMKQPSCSHACSMCSMLMGGDKLLVLWCAQWSVFSADGKELGSRLAPVMQA